MQRHGSEERRGLQAPQKIDYRGGLLRGYYHVQGHFVARIDLRQTHLHQPHVVGHHAFEIGKDARPANGLALDQGARPAEDSLIVLTPLGLDATALIAADGFDARRAIAFDTVFPGRAVRCLFANPAFAETWREPARAAFHAEGIDVYLVRDSVGLIAQRVLAHIVNVACAIAEQRIASPMDIDRAVKLGLGYPQGPLAWGDSIGASNLRRILDGLLASTGDPRYRTTAWLARRAALGLPLGHAD
jgi:3-hydroxybutyryl-CoA dehydrogenase